MVNDSGSYLYNPGTDREKMVEIQSEDDYDKILRWYREGMHRILDGRPDIDWATRAPGAPNATLLEFPVTIATYDWFMFQVETYPAGASVQNMRLAAEGMGLGNWVFCGYFDDVLMGAYPNVAQGLKFRCEPPNEKAPLATGALKIFGKEGIKEAQYVPSPRFPNGESIIKFHLEEKYGEGHCMSPGTDNWMLARKGPFKEQTLKAILEHPRCQVSNYAIDASIAFIDYCVDRYGQCPPYINPMQCNFGGVVHHVDEEFYEKNYDGSSLTPQIREHMQRWH